MQLNETLFYKMLQFYGKIYTFRVSFMNISLESLNCNIICNPALYIIYSVYVIVIPIIYIYVIIDSYRSETNRIFVYIYATLFQCLLSLYCLIKIFKKSKDNELPEAFTGLTIEDEDEKFYTNNLLFSVITLSIMISMPPIFLTITNDVLPYFFSSVRISSTIHLKTSKPLDLTVSLAQLLLNGLSLTFILLIPIYA